ncbi:ribosomal protein L5 [Reticulomyxa filosa]|uniref:Ribosomal protein L5 n=1 Tax=Reticulomyxa filosa TaxID=46433 RepID=X6LV07_RETFI|nr:ribosomal protein L5 [Reticulomyxa filosa]|eukprot:ETO04560.1 ribosomal protein L5 [Reticulomyxa filosa]
MFGVSQLLKFANFYDIYLWTQHVADYMKKLQTDNTDKYNKQFSQFVKEGVTADNLEQLIRKTSKLPKVKKDWKSTQKIRKTPKMSKQEKNKLINAAVVARKPTEAAKPPASGDVTMAEAK